MNQFSSAKFQLRRLTIDDYSNMRLLESNPLVMRFTTMKVAQNEEQTKVRIVNQIAKQKKYEPLGIWIAERKKDQTFIGWFMLIPDDQHQIELGFMICQDYWGKGYTTEICQTLIDFVNSERPNYSLVAKTTLNNTASIRVLQKLGFKYIEDTVSADQTPIKFFKREKASKF
jgi:[ribosomal protein S5]-alanine N-acetyltransferase